jgi:ribosomal protein L21
VIYKYKRRKGFARKQGHRQPFTMLSVTDIRLG